jgi:hypothetical protein
MRVQIPPLPFDSPLESRFATLKRARSWRSPPRRMAVIANARSKSRGRAEPVEPSASPLPPSSRRSASADFERAFGSVAQREGTCSASRGMRVQIPPLPSREASSNSRTPVSNSGSEGAIPSASVKEGGRVTVTPEPLTLVLLVRIQPPLFPCPGMSASGQGGQVLSLETRVRIPPSLSRAGLRSSGRRTLAK